MSITIRYKKGKTKMEEIAAKLSFLKRDEEYIISIEKVKSWRSKRQNRLLWLWLKCLAQETGSSKEDFYGMYCDKFLRELKTINGKQIWCSRGSSTLSTSEFAEFLKQIQVDAEVEWDIRLPLPEDEAWDYFYEMYGQD